MSFGEVKGGRVGVARWGRQTSQSSTTQLHAKEWAKQSIGNCLHKHRVLHGQTWVAELSYTLQPLREVHVCMIMVPNARNGPVAQPKHAARLDKWDTATEE